MTLNLELKVEVLVDLAPDLITVHRVLVDRAVAVLVRAVAGLEGGRVDRRVVVVTVAAGVVPVVVVVDPVLVDDAVAIVVDLVADLGGVRIDGDVGVVAVTLALGVPITVYVEAGESIRGRVVNRLRLVAKGEGEVASTETDAEHDAQHLESVEHMSTPITSHLEQVTWL